MASFFKGTNQPIPLFFAAVIIHSSHFRFFGEKIQVQSQTGKYFHLFRDTAPRIHFSIPKFPFQLPQLCV